MTVSEKIIMSVLFFVTLILLSSSVYAQTVSPQTTLNQYISDLQKNPSDYALREKIIKHVQETKPAPAIPEEARRYFIEGNALLKAAKAQKGYELAIDAYRQCLLTAPWWAEAYYNYSVALELANRFDEAVNVLKLYIATNPGEGESRKAQDKIYEIGAKKKLAAQEKEESSPQGVAAKKQNEFEQWLKRLDGARYQYEKPSDCGHLIIEIHGSTLIFGAHITNVQGGCRALTLGDREYARVDIRGRKVIYGNDNPVSGPHGPRTFNRTWIISEDKINQTVRYSDGDVEEDIYRRVR